MREKPEKSYFFIVFTVFVIAILVGYLWGLLFPTQNQELLKQALGPLKSLKNASTLALFIFIFFNNSIKALFSIFLGLFFGLFPIYFIYMNGFIIGIVLALSVLGPGLGYFLAATLPHGIIEIFAIVMAAGYGLWLGTKLARFWFKKEKTALWPAFRYALKKYFIIVLPLLFVAAIIEAYITPKVVLYFFK